MTSTSRFGFTLLYSNQAQKSVVINQNTINLDALLMLACVSASLTAPPVTPSDQVVYIVAAGATGVWAGHDTQVAIYQASSASWTFFVPQNGWTCYNQATNTLYVFNGTSWGTVPNLSALTPTNNYVIVGNGTQFVTTDLNALVTSLAQTVAYNSAFMWAMIFG